jgi:isoleucyl-tRNA synthetase
MRGALIDGAHLSDNESATPQLAMTAIAETRFVPEKGRNRIGSMVEGPRLGAQPQRAWACQSQYSRGDRQAAGRSRGQRTIVAAIKARRRRLG